MFILLLCLYYYYVYIITILYFRLAILIAGYLYYGTHSFLGLATMHITAIIVTKDQYVRLSRTNNEVSKLS